MTEKPTKSPQEKITKPALNVVAKNSTKWISEHDIPEIISILCAADKISPDEAVKRLNKLVSKGTVFIVPLLGTKRKS